jgi:hypothetical protein
VGKSTGEILTLLAVGGSYWQLLAVIGSHWQLNGEITGNISGVYY